MRREPVVLIVDTEEIFHEMAPILERELVTTQVLHCDNSCDALKIIESDIVIDFIFSDWKVGGAGFIEAVRNNHAHHHTPLVMMSFVDSDEIIATAMRLGATAHMAKPFLEKGLVNKIQQLTKKQERRRLRRLHPDKHYTVDIECKNAGPIQVELVDFSVGCCLTRAPIALAGMAIVGQQGLMHLRIEQYFIDIEAVLFRIEEDTSSSTPGNSILMTFRITDQRDEQISELRELVDEYGHKW